MRHVHKLATRPRIETHSKTPAGGRRYYSQSGTFHVNLADEVFLLRESGNWQLIDNARDTVLDAITYYHMRRLARVTGPLLLVLIAAVWFAVS